ncbi:MAG: hypothetical protein ACKO9F_21985 [Caldilinea sp.]
MAAVKVYPRGKTGLWGWGRAGLVALAIVGCGTVPADVVVESGVTALAGTAPAPLDAVEQEAGMALPTAEEVSLLSAGTDVRARGMLRIYAAPEPVAATLAEYVAGDLLTVVEPPGDIATYPVELNGVLWYRVRAADGLVGWAMADGIELSDLAE